MQSIITVEVGYIYTFSLVREVYNFSRNKFWWVHLVLVMVDYTGCFLSTHWSRLKKALETIPFTLVAFGTYTFIDQIIIIMKFGTYVFSYIYVLQIFWMLYIAQGTLVYIDLRFIIIFIIFINTLCTYCIWWILYKFFFYQWFGLV